MSDRDPLNPTTHSETGTGFGWIMRIGSIIILLPVSLSIYLIHVLIPVARQERNRARVISGESASDSVDVSPFLIRVLPFLIPILAGAAFSMLVVYGGVGATTGWLYGVAIGLLVSLAVAVVLYAALVIWNRMRPKHRQAH